MRFTCPVKCVHRVQCAIPVQDSGSNIFYVVEVLTSRRAEAGAPSAGGQTCRGGPSEAAGGSAAGERAVGAGASLKSGGRAAALAWSIVSCRLRSSCLSLLPEPAWSSDCTLI